MHRCAVCAALPLLVFLLTLDAAAGEPANLLEDASFELIKDKDRFGLVFDRWGGWIYEGDCEFAVGQVARSGRHSCLLVGGAGAKIRVVQLQDLEPGRYRITAYLRGLDIGTGTWNATTEFMFDGRYMQLNKNGTFGWTRLTYVAELGERKQAGPSFGLMAPGRLWIDDVSLVAVGRDVPLTEQPVLEPEQAPLVPPGDLTDGAVRCVQCGYRNMPRWGRCYACGEELAAEAEEVRPQVLAIASFEQDNPFQGGSVVAEHATDGSRALRLDRSYTLMDQSQDWRGYDYLKVDLHTAAAEPLPLYVEIRDTATRDYWTRVNYETVVPPGSSTLVLPIQQLYVGEKSRPGRMLLLGGIARLVFSIGDEPAAPLFLDNLRLERDESAERAAFDGLYAFDFGLNTSPVMEGFTPITPGTLYSRGRGYGLNAARIWRAFDALQPDPLYQDFLCIESGGLAVDVPAGRYRVLVNMDSPSGFWGEYQVYRQRRILAEGRPMVEERLEFEELKAKYFRFWDREDLPGEDTFDKYQKPYFDEKLFDVEVADGQLNLDFEGENWACSVSAVVIFPLDKAEQGGRFLEFMEARRRFHFDNYFKRVLRPPSGPPLVPTAEQRRRGYIGFVRDYMQDVYYHDTPAAGEIDQPIRGAGFAGELEPLTLALVPLQDLGEVQVSVSDLLGPAGTLPSANLDVGFVSYRLSRVTMQGSVYTIRPRLIMPTGTVAMPAGVTRRFWFTVRTPEDAQPGTYRGSVSIQPQHGQPQQWPIEFRVRAGRLDAADIPVGPWGYQIDVPWPGSDPQARAYNQQLADKSLRRMREYGFTAFSGVPVILYRGFQDGQPVLDFSQADPMMDRARELGFLAVVSYGGGVRGINPYYQDTAQMTAAGFSDYAGFIQAVYRRIQEHAEQRDWLPVYFNLGDEPIGEDLIRSAENAEAYRRAFPQGPPYFTAASSLVGDDSQDPHFRLSRAVHVANWNLHDEASVKLLRDAGGDWAFYNGGNRWTYGAYLYKAVQEFGLKFRLSWHWNVVAGDPYYALDCREDDYAWCNSSPDGELIPAVQFEQLREGLDDYRRLLTLARLVERHAGRPQAEAADRLIKKRLAEFRLGQRDHDGLFGAADWKEFRRQVDEALETLQ